MISVMMKLVEESSGAGELTLDGEPPARVSYRIKRFQGFNDASGLPIPGLHRLEGTVECAEGLNRTWIGVPVKLRMENGGVYGFTLTEDGRIFGEGHGPSKCLCC